jgi:hypothetical protein
MAEKRCKLVSDAVSNSNARFFGCGLRMTQSGAARCGLKLTAESWLLKADR